MGCGLFEVCERGLDGLGVAPGLQFLDACDLFGLEGRVDTVELGLLLVVEDVAVDADDDPLLGLDLGLVPDTTPRRSRAGRSSP